MKSDESTPRIIQSLLVHWSQTNPTIASHAHVLGGSSRVHAPLRTADKPLLTSAWETNPTRHLLIKPRWKWNGAGKVWHKLGNYKTLLRVGREIFTQRRVTRIFLVKNLKYFSIRLFLFHNNSNACAVPLPFITDFQEKVVVLIISFSSKDCAHNKYAYSKDIKFFKSKNQPWVYFMQSTVKKGHLLLRYRKFNQLISFFLTNVNSSLFRLNFWRAVTYPPLLSDMAIRLAAHCWTDAIFNPLHPKIKIWILTWYPYSFPTDVVGRSW